MGSPAAVPALQRMGGGAFSGVQFGHFHVGSCARFACDPGAGAVGVSWARMRAYFTCPSGWIFQPEIFLLRVRSVPRPAVSSPLYCR